MKYFAILLFIIYNIHLYSQIGDIIKIEKGKSSFHQAHVGNILFCKNSIETSHPTDSNFVTDYTLTNKSNLYFTAFLDNSLTNSLHRLSPSLGADSLVKIGNFQFTLFVDDHIIYQSNLHPGAPYSKIKDSATILNYPLIDPDHSWWTQSFWSRFMNRGGDSALTEGKHKLRMEIKPYLQLESLVVGNIMGIGDVNVTVNRKPKIDIAKIKLNPIHPYHGLKISSDYFDRNKIKELKGNIEEAVFKKINGVVVIKNDKILIEEYFNGENRSSLHDPRSVGKSFASTITGIAIQDGFLKNEEQSLNEFYNLPSYSNYSAQKGKVTIKDLLTMSATLDGDDNEDSSPGNEENMYPTDDWVRFALDLPINTVRLKSQWHYFTAGVVLMGDILNKAVPDGLEKYAEQKLFSPMGIKYQWQYTPQHVPNTAGGIQLNALDFAKYGQLYKNNGLWKGRQIIPKDWVVKTFTKQRTIPNRINEYYGYLFWNKTYEVHGKKYETFYCAGNGGNKIFIFKDLPLVIVVTASAYGQSYAHPQVDRMMTDYILPALKM